MNQVHGDFPCDGICSKKTEWFIVRITSQHSKEDITRALNLNLK